MDATSAGSFASAQDRSWLNTSLSPDDRAALLLAQMTLDEKGSLVHGEPGGPSGYYIAPIPRLGIPALTMTDGPAGINVGRATALPAPIGLAATWDLTIAEQYGELLGSEAEATGHNVYLGPCLDIARVPTYGRLFEAFGEDPILTGQMAVRSIQSVQCHHIVATLKHYNVNAQDENRLEVDVQLDERTLQVIYTLPFASAVQGADVGAATGAYNKVNGVYCCENRHLLTDILKEQLGFQGWVVSDYEATHSAVEAANAGLDQEMPNGIFFGDSLLNAIQTGGEYALSLTHLGTARLFLDDQLLIEDPGITLDTHSVTLRRVADQPYTLRLEYAADRPEQYVPVPGELVIAGLLGSKVRFSWEHPAQAVPSAMQEAATLAGRSDVAIVVVRDYRNEHADVPRLTLSNEQDMLVQMVAAANARTVVVLTTGGPALMPWLDQVPAVLESWYGGQEQGNALADVLFGNVNPFYGPKGEQYRGEIIDTWSMTVTPLEDAIEYGTVVPLPGTPHQVLILRRL